MQRPRFVVGLSVIAAVAFCTASLATELDEHTLSTAERQWSEAKIHSYDFTFDYGAFVPPCVPPKFRFKVIKDAPVHRERRCGEFQAEFGSVPLLFEFLARALAATHSSIDADFDPKYGFPRKVWIDWSGITDDFETFTVTDLRVH